jgi:peptide deformylase
MEEAYLSVPETRAEVIRAVTIALKYDDLVKYCHSETFAGLSERVLLHAIDYLNGKFFTYYFSKFKRMFIQKSLQEITLTGSPLTGIIES